MKITLTLLLLILSINTFGQNDTIISKETKELAIKLEKKHPAKFFDSASRLYKAKHLNDAAFLFYLGQLRYKYYLAAGEGSDSDGQLFASLQNVLGEQINFDLGENLDNYLMLLEEVINWDRLNDYKYYSKTNLPGKHKKVLEGLINYKNWVIENKSTITERRNKVVEDRKK